MDNILIANEGGSNHFVLHTRKKNHYRVTRCTNQIDVNRWAHWAVLVDEEGLSRVYKNGE